MHRGPNPINIFLPWPRKDPNKKIEKVKERRSTSQKGYINRGVQMLHTTIYMKYLCDSRIAPFNIVLFRQTQWPRYSRYLKHRNALKTLF